MIFATALTALLMLYFAVWCWLMTRRPRYWRLWWMLRLGHVEVRSTKEERRQLDRIFRTFAIAACLASVMAVGWGIAWTWMQVRALKPVPVIREGNVQTPGREVVSPSSIALSKSKAQRGW